MNNETPLAQGPVECRVVPDWVGGLLNRRAAVEQTLFNCAAGRQPLPTADMCRDLALKLGVPDEYRIAPDAALAAKCIKHYEQKHDGSFDHYVVFGGVTPWDAPDDLCVKCASEDEADKLVALLSQPREASDEMIDAACAAVPDMYRVDASRAIEAALAVMLNGD